MTHPDHERDERELKALFDATAEEVSGAGLTRLRARAADVPGRARRRRWRLWVPAVAFGAGLLLVVLLVGRSRDGDGARDPVAAVDTLRAPEPPAPPAPSPSAGPKLDEEAPEERAELADLGALGDADDLDDLAAPPDELDDAELEAWLDATSAFLEDG